MKLGILLSVGDKLYGDKPPRSLHSPLSPSLKTALATFLYGLEKLNTFSYFFK